LVLNSNHIYRKTLNSKFSYCFKFKVLLCAEFEFKTDYLQEFITANCVFEHDFKCIAVAEYLLFQNQGGYLTQKKVKKKRPAC